MVSIFGRRNRTAKNRVRRGRTSRLRYRGGGANPGNMNNGDYGNGNGAVVQPAEARENRLRQAINSLDNALVGINELHSRDIVRIRLAMIYGPDDIWTGAAAQVPDFNYGTKSALMRTVVKVTKPDGQIVDDRRLLRIAYMITRERQNLAAALPLAPENVAIEMVLAFADMDGQVRAAVTEVHKATMAYLVFAQGNARTLPIALLKEKNLYRRTVDEMAANAALFAAGQIPQNY